ncbi:MAG: FeoA family protein [Myxococcota bacterium]
MPNPSHEPVSLASLRPGASVEVVRVDGEDVLARRLVDHGFWPGTRVDVVRRAPFGDPTQYRLRGFRLALRKSEAARIFVVPAPAGP